MSAECCGTPDEHDDAHEETEQPQRPWEVPEFQLAAAAGVLLLAGFAAGWTGFATASIVLYGGAATVGGRTFVPGTLRNLRKRRIAAAGPVRPGGSGGRGGGLALRVSHRR